MVEKMADMALIRLIMNGTIKKKKKKKGEGGFGSGVLGAWRSVAGASCWATGQRSLVFGASGARVVGGFAN